MGDIWNMADKGKVPINFIDDPHAPEVFASDITGFFIVGANVVMTLESARVDHSESPGPLNRVVIARVVMPIDTAQRLVVGMNDFLTARGFSPSEAVAGPGAPN